MALLRTNFIFAILCCQMICLTICQSFTETPEDTNLNESRTFGHHFLKRISFAIIPAAFVVGVITTLLAALTVVSMKGLGVGVILLVIALGQILARSVGSQASPFQAPYPVIYSQRQAVPESNPIWLEKTWR